MQLILACLTRHSSVARALEASMLPAAKDSAGARILKKMGWRIGQGIGPRVTLRQRKLQDLHALSGRRVAEADIVIPNDDEEASKHTYAPRDTSILVVERKDNSHGLGYHPGMGLSESVGGRSGAASGPKLACLCLLYHTFFY
jgi:G patch domain-containing protein 1